jgi:acyl-CoA synthetase (AMP-forming)/AMP-acid ligase II
MQSSVFAQRKPAKSAYIMSRTGENVTYGQLEERSNQAAHALRRLGLRIGDAIALCLDTGPRYHEIAWGAHRAGLIYVPISVKALADDVAYIVGDCNAKAVMVSQSLRALGDKLRVRAPKVEHWLSVGGPRKGYTQYEWLRDRQPVHRISDEASGLDVRYASSITGRSNGSAARIDRSEIDAEHLRELRDLYAIDENTVYFSPAPIYCGASLRFTMGLMRVGGTSVLTERFDPEQALALIARYRVTHAQFAPTMFARMLDLPESVRRRYDFSSLRVVIHAAPCPLELKQRMLEWWGPILYESCGASEGLGSTSLDGVDHYPQETDDLFLSHPAGSL